MVVPVVAQVMQPVVVLAAPVMSRLLLPLRVIMVAGLAVPRLTTAEVVAVVQAP
jgi:hypothetical protein